MKLLEFFSFENFLPGFFSLYACMCELLIEKCVLEQGAKKNNTIFKNRKKNSIIKLVQGTCIRNWKKKKWEHRKLERAISLFTFGNVYFFVRYK